MLTSSPYPTLIELVRLINQIFDLKTSEKKKLDDRIQLLVINPQLIDELITKTILAPLEQILGKNLINILKEEIYILKKDYLKVISLCDASFLCRKDISKIIIQDFLSSYVVKKLLKFWIRKKAPELVTLFSDTESAVTTMINWLSCHNKQWKILENQIEIEDKAKIYAWRKGINIPSTSHINELTVPGFIKRLLLISAAIERIKKYSYGYLLINEIRILLWKGNIPNISHKTINEKLIKSQRLVFSNFYQDFAFYYFEIDNILKNKKDFINRANIENGLLILDGLIDKNKKMNMAKPHVDWLWARFFVFSGELEKASKKYQQLLSSFLYTGGVNQKLIIEEALVVIANCSKIDNLFLKTIKWAAVTFEYDILSVENVSVSNRIEDNIQDWEIEIWKNSFYTVVPKAAFFLDCELSLVQPKVGPLVIYNRKNIKPDYRNPNRKIPIGDTWHKKMPQLIWFISQEQYEEFKKLLDRGASINVVSDVGETPLIMALEIINNSESIEPDLRFFNLLCKKVHSQEIVNIRTEKLKKSALFLAIDTGIPEVVKQVLELGADPHLLASCDRLSALYYCMSKIAKLKQSQQDKNQMLEPLHTGYLSEYHVDSIKRYSNGASGFSNQDIISDWQNKYSDPIYKEIFSIVTGIDTKRSFKDKSLENYRKIAINLIDKGANVNCEQIQPIKGYTPFMLAAEMDEVELFKSMYEHGGDLSKTYRDYGTYKDKNIKEIASYFKSEGILDFLNTLRQ